MSLTEQEMDVMQRRQDGWRKEESISWHTQTAADVTALVAEVRRLKKLTEFDVDLEKCFGGGEE